MVIGPSAPFTRLLSKDAPANTTPLLVGDFLRVDHPLRPAKSLKGLCRMTNPCGVSHGQMAKVELWEVRCISFSKPRQQLRCRYAVLGHIECRRMPTLAPRLL